MRHAAYYGDDTEGGMSAPAPEPTPQVVPEGPPPKVPGWVTWAGLAVALTAAAAGGAGGFGDLLQRVAQ